ncbi:fluoride efflux transporter FluC [Apilactobacillus micheneri]|uniref:Fluoride-specific ion channel FluC n=1 Tax=Apilactobacillus micheneri TaxID=1899430 RepID=A0A9Q8IM98_9LACO|nr:CrcB family protein [Apilactobacillus micheneri]TPR39954.1 CrcB family protein [Apilactobacillus micheneri]TPR41767.1 CrcB family protein [Apilactobacillus micheneri]TPR44156.1 CrcB family protein [Apilactobacillus micheneri]TPR45780.1 CrcB family protein [Apilactobacillus micheneri]TPR51543.1 CrcB family protein [Apilactobacillus micheneri]
MRKVIYIFIFGFVGGILRGYFTFISGNNHFIATAIINIVGSFLLALMTGMLPKVMNLSESFISGMSMGLIGGFTTFSTFSFDSINLLINHEIGLGVLYILVSLIGGLIFANLGNSLGNLIMFRGEVR